MRATNIRPYLRAACAAAALALSLPLTTGAALGADDKTYVMKITLPTINDALHGYAKGFAALVEKDSGGRIKGEVYPASQLGAIGRQIEGVQFGAIQAAVMPPEFYVGVDERFEVMTAPGLVNTIEHGQRIAEDASVQKMMLGLGANKGLHGVGLFIAQPSSIITKTGIRHLADFKGKKLRIFASDFQSQSLKRLGATPVAMTLADVLPALQQGAIDGAIAGLAVYTNMQYQDAAKYVTETGQPFIFAIVETSLKWYDSLPKDLQVIIDADGAKEAMAINPIAIEMYNQGRKAWVAQGGELISLPPDEQSAMMETLASVAGDLSKPKPELSAAYQLVSGVARRTR
jgi:TRAP-type C4-dicarboxylate transport system substrate-binding protein